MSDVITQEMLRNYEAVCATRNFWKKRAAELRAALADQYDAGAATETGELELRVYEYDSRPLTHQKVSAVVGSEGLQYLLERIDPTTSRTVRVKRRSNDRPRSGHSSSTWTT